MGPIQIVSLLDIKSAEYKWRHVVPVVRDTLAELADRCDLLAIEVPAAKITRMPWGAEGHRETRLMHVACRHCARRVLQPAIEAVRIERCPTHGFVEIQRERLLNMAIKQFSISHHRHEARRRFLKSDGLPKESVTFSDLLQHAGLLARACGNAAAWAVRVFAVPLVLRRLGADEEDVDLAERVCRCSILDEIR